MAENTQAEHTGGGGRESGVHPAQPGGALPHPAVDASHKAHPTGSEHLSPHGPMGSALGEVLLGACEGRLSDLHWFRTDWQRGGALTGYGLYRNGDSGHDGQASGRPVVAKLPVPPRELMWLRRLQEAGDVAPHLLAWGQTLGGYDIAWVVMERMPHGPLGSVWQGAEFDLLVESVGRFYRASSAFPAEGNPKRVDWNDAYDRTRKNVSTHGLPDEQRWSHALKKAHKKLKDWAAIWEDRPVEAWCHGDLHLKNAMTRQPAPAGPAVLLDYAETRPGHWVEDAVYFEHLYWSRRDRLGGRKLCRQIAQERKKLGLVVEADWPRLAEVRRILLAMTTPLVLGLHGEPHHLRAALEIVEGAAG
ncbi:MAG: phosphotransferase [Phycisphaeraceae bacterium]|nr:phosphotransferase [Phycisphaeraceae bacterium]